MSQVRKSKFPHSHRVARAANSDVTPPTPPPILPAPADRVDCAGCRSYLYTGIHDRACPLPHKNPPRPAAPPITRSDKLRQKGLDKSLRRHHDDDDA